MTASEHRRAWRTTWLLVAFMLVNFADKMVMGLVANPVMTELHLTREQFGTASAAFFALFSLAALGGSFLTRTVRTPVLLLGMALLWSAAQLPMLLGVAGFGVLVATRVLLGAAEGPATPVAVHHLHGWFEERDRTLPTAIFLVGAAVGVAVAAPVLGAVTAAWGWRWAFGVVGLVGLVWAAVWLRYGEEGPLAPPVGRRRVSDAPVGQRSADSAPVGRRSTDGTPVGKRPARNTSLGGGSVPYRKLLLSRTWLSAALGAFAAFWTVSASLTWAVDYFQEVGGLGLRQASLLIMLAALAKGTAMLAHGLLVQRAGRRAAAGLRPRIPLPSGVKNGLVLLLSGAATLAFAATDVLWLKAVLLLGPMAGSDIIMTVAQTSVSRISPADRRGVALGALTCVFALAGVLAPAVTGRLVDAGETVADGYLGAYGTMAGLTVLAGVAVTLFLRPERDAWRLGVAEARVVRG
ncbi:MFS transporter [Streptomyces monomycini]|uniref:MFS transporter n=1 Tax=Streptomyces monomycini TaxID=371720 RepID=UPI0012FEFD80|nr:MFS transporter [Streptomyces monomycini]